MRQVVLSFGIALAIIPLLYFTNSKKIMGKYQNSKMISNSGLIIVAIVLALNLISKLHIISLNL